MSRALLTSKPQGRPSFGWRYGKRTAKFERRRFRRLERTTQVANESLGWAEVRHPFHPLKGQRFSVLKKRRWAGKETLILGHPEHGSFGILREWTDWGALTECADGTAPAL